MSYRFLTFYFRKILDLQKNYKMVVSTYSPYLVSIVNTLKWYETIIMTNEPILAHYLKPIFYLIFLSFYFMFFFWLHDTTQDTMLHI